VRLLGVGVELVAVAELLGQVLGQVADAPVRVPRSGQHAFSAELLPEPGHADLVAGLPGAISGVPDGLIHEDFRTGTGRVPFAAAQLWA
jgi:hypothetical protein